MKKQVMISLGWKLGWEKSGPFLELPERTQVSMHEMHQLASAYERLCSSEAAMAVEVEKQSEVQDEIAGPHRVGEWFHRLFGFREKADGTPQRWREIKSKFVLEPGDANPRAPQTLRSSVNGKRWQVGVLSTPTLGELKMAAKTALERKRLGDPAFLRGRSRVDYEYGDIALLLKDDERYSHATFQVASQFNCLEFIHPDKRREDGIGIYENDKTQGPACSIACGPATVVRNYFAEDLGFEPEINNLQDTIEQLDGKYVHVIGGYTLPQHQEALADLRLHLDKLNVFRDGSSGTNTNQADLSCLKAADEGSAGACHLRLLTESVRVGVHAGVEVTGTRWGTMPFSNPRHLVTQVFCSACSVAYDASSSKHDWEPLSRIALDAAYEACAWAAVVEACRHNGAMGSSTLVLTILGGGAFGNPFAWIADAIGRALHQLELEDVGLRVIINNYVEFVPDEIDHVQKVFNKRFRDGQSGGRGSEEGGRRKRTDKQHGYSPPEALEAGAKEDVSECNLDPRRLSRQEQDASGRRHDLVRGAASKTAVEWQTAAVGGYSGGFDSGERGGHEAARE